MTNNENESQKLQLNPINHQWVPDSVMKALAEMNVDIGQAYEVETLQLKLLSFFHGDGVYGIYFDLCDIQWFDLMAKDDFLAVTVGNTPIATPKESRPGTRKMMLPEASLDVLFDTIRGEIAQMKLIPLDPCDFVEEFQDVFEKEQLWLEAQKKDMASRLLLIRINDKCEPIDRGDLYEDPLDDALWEQGYGSVEGGGTQLKKNVGVEYCEIEVVVSQGQDPSVVCDFIAAECEKLFLPKGSKIIRHDQDDLPIGKAEVLAFAFNNEMLNDDSIEEDINDIITEMGDSIEGEGRFTSHRATDGETIVYFCGNGYASMQSKMAPIISKYKRGQKGRFYQEA